MLNGLVVQLVVQLARLCAGAGGCAGVRAHAHVRAGFSPQAHLLVKVMARMLCARARPERIRCSARATSSRVFPLPGPAFTRTCTSASMHATMQAGRFYICMHALMQVGAGGAPRQWTCAAKPRVLSACATNGSCVKF